MRSGSPRWGAAGLCVGGAAVLVLLALAPRAKARAPAPDRPNILFIVSDDQRWDALGAAGNPIIQTPNIDRLAEEGIRFTNNFCTTSICWVSRASLLSSQYETRHDGYLTPYQLYDTYPLLLRRTGYWTGFVGKWGLTSDLPPQEFDYWRGYADQGVYWTNLPFYPHITTTQSRQAVNFLQDAPEPFLLTVCFKAAHAQDDAPRLWPPPLEDEPLYQDVVIPMPATATATSFSALPGFVQTSEGRTRWYPRFSTPELFQSNVKDYYREITGMDRAIGAMRAVLEARGLLERTLIVFTSDNGLFLGEHGMSEKWLAYEESIRTPLVIRWPALPASRRGARLTDFALNIDLAPTVLEAAGVPIPEVMQGRSLVPLVLGTPVEWRGDFLYTHHYDHGGTIPPVEAVRTARWKYVRYLQGGYEQLFDLALDPGEENDLVHAPPADRTERRLADHALDTLRVRWARYREELR